MKMLIVAAFAAALMTGCATTKTETALVVKYKYVYSSIPEELMTIPEPMYKIDPRTATDKDAAKWMIDSEKRALEIESRLRAIREYQEKKIQELKNNEKLGNDVIIIN